jgi:hypothetical protein
MCQFENSPNTLPSPRKSFAQLSLLASQTIVRNWPLSAEPPDRLSTTAIEGATDQMRFQAVVDRRAETAAVNAIASGSQVSTMRAFSHRIARSSSSPGIDKLGHVADRCSLGLGLPALGCHRSTFSLEGCKASGLPIPLIHVPHGLGAALP